MNMEKILYLNPNNETEEIEEYLYIMSIKNNKVYVFNEFEKNIVLLFDKDKKVEEVSAILKSQYESYDENEFLSFIQNLCQKELLLSI